MALAFMALPIGAHAQEVPAVPPEAAVVEPEPVIVTLAPVSGAEGTGEARLKAGPAGTETALEVSGLAPGSHWAAFLIEGTCEEPGETISPLGTVEVGAEGAGKGEAAITAPLGELVAGDATVQLHPHAEAPTTAVLCGAVSAAQPQVPAF